MKKKYLVEFEVFVKSNTDKKNIKYAIENLVIRNFEKLITGDFFETKIAPGKITVTEK